MKLTNKARSLRQSRTDVEHLLWQKLRNRQLLNFKFRRQFPIDPFIVDYSCLELKLIIELDGSQHSEQAQYDNERSFYLAQRGFKVIRFWNNDVINNIEGVLEEIYLVILILQVRKNDFIISPHPTLSLWRGLFLCATKICV